MGAPPHGAGEQHRILDWYEKPVSRTTRSNFQTRSVKSKKKEGEPHTNLWDDSELGTQLRKADILGDVQAVDEDPSVTHLRQSKQQCHLHKAQRVDIQHRASTVSGMRAYATAK